MVAEPGPDVQEDEARKRPGYSNSGAKPAYCAAKHINHSSDQRNEAAATNDAVVPRARR